MRARFVVCGLVAVVLTAACGSRLPEDVLSAIDAGQTSTGGGTATGPAGPGGGGRRTTTGPSPVTGGGRGGGVTTSGGGGLPTGSGGSTRITTPVGSSGGNGGNGGGRGGSAASTCDGLPADAPGVTDTQIKVASIVTDSGPLPGATEGAYRGAASYFAKVNAEGGLCGREVVLLKGDDGLDPQKARSEFLRLEPQVLAFVGSYSVADSGYIGKIEETGVPYVALTVDPSGRGLPNVMPRVTSTHVNTAPFVWWKQQNPDVERAALLFAQVAGVEDNIPGFEAAMREAGFDRQYTASAQVAAPDYTPEVRAAQDADIEFFYLFAFEVSMHVRMVRSMRQQNYDPPIKGSIIGFNTRFSELLGTDGDGWQNHQTHLLFLDPEERNRSRPLAEFVDWNNTVFPGGQLDLFPVSGWGRADYFTDAMRRIKGKITRQSLLDALYEVPVYDGGGLEGPLNPQDGLGEPCFTMAVHRNGGWVREYPKDELFECDLGTMYKFRD